MTGRPGPGLAGLAPHAFPPAPPWGASGPPPSRCLPFHVFVFIYTNGQGWAVGFRWLESWAQSGAGSPGPRAWLAVSTGKGVPEGPPPDL